MNLKERELNQQQKQWTNKMLAKTYYQNKLATGKLTQLEIEFLTYEIKNYIKKFSATTDFQVWHLFSKI